MCGIGIIHHHDSEFYSSQFQFQTILTEIPPLIFKTKNDSDSNSHWSPSQPRSESAPGQNNVPVIIILVCKINVFKK